MDWNKICTWAAGLIVASGSSFYAVWNGAPALFRGLVPVVLILVLSDSLLGSWAAVCDGTFERKKLNRSMFKVMAYAVAVVLVYCVDHGVWHILGSAGQDWGYWFSVTLISTMFYREAVSNLRLLKKLGVPIPTYFEKALDNCKTKMANPLQDALPDTAKDAPVKS